MASSLISQLSNKRPRLAFITQSCFVQCDLAVLPVLLSEFDVDWNVFFPVAETGRYTEQELTRFAEDQGIRCGIYRLFGRLRTWGTFRILLRMIRHVRSVQPDVVYVNAFGLPWLAPLLWLLIPKSKILWALHDVVDHTDKRTWSPQALYRKILVATAGGIHTLSRNQTESFQRKYPGRSSFFAPHPPIDPGLPSVQKPSYSRVRFLFFGVIADYKGLDQLLEASQQLRESGVENFDVEIAGSCYDWEGDYASKIRIPDMFKLRIGMVPNADLPDLFESAHWLVLPYRDATQSGPLSLAMRYNKPAIASNLPAFQEFLQEGQTGLIFQSGDVAGLREEMRKAVLMGGSGYDRICTALAEDVESRYSLRAVAASFAEMFRVFAKQSPKR